MTRRNSVWWEYFQLPQNPSETPLDLCGCGSVSLWAISGCLVYGPVAILDMEPVTRSQSQASISWKNKKTRKQKNEKTKKQTRNRGKSCSLMTSWIEDKHPMKSISHCANPSINGWCYRECYRRACMQKCGPHYACTQLPGADHWLCQGYHAKNIMPGDLSIAFFDCFFSVGAEADN